MKEESESTTEEGLTRRRFIQAGASATVAASFLPILNLRRTGVTAQEPPSQSALPASKLTASADHPPKPSAPATANAGAKTWVCPPCGMPCDKLTFDKPGQCPNCNMTLVPADGEGGPPKVAILVFNGVELIDFAGPWEVFGTAGFLVHTVAETPESCTAVFGQKMIPDHTFDNAPKADILLVPGGGNVPFSNDKKLIGWIQDKSKQVSHVMSVCTGAFLLAKAGLLEGQTVTTTTGMIEDLQTSQTKVVYDQRFVDNGKIITTAGLSAGIDGALHLVSRILGRATAQRVALGMEYRWDPDGRWARAALADLYMPARIKGADILITSYEGDADRWEIKFLVSHPSSSAEIVALLRESIAAYKAVGGMMGKRTPHIPSPPTFEERHTNDSELRWKFTDDQGRNWSGLGSVEPAPDDKSKFIATLKIARQGRA